MTQVSVAQDGISKLLAAEQEAQKIVAAARKSARPNSLHSPLTPCLCDLLILRSCDQSVVCCGSCEPVLVDDHRCDLHAPVPWVLAAKSDRLKQAKADADKEVAAYKAEREAAYKEKMASVRHCSGTLSIDGSCGSRRVVCNTSFCCLSMSDVSKQHQGRHCRTRAVPATL